MNDSSLDALIARCEKYRFYKYTFDDSIKRPTWVYVRLPEGETPKTFFTALARSYGMPWYRSISYRKALPPKSWFEQQILDLRKNAGNLTRLADDFCWIHRFYDKR